MMTPVSVWDRCSRVRSTSAPAPATRRILADEVTPEIVRRPLRGVDVARVR